MKRADSIHLKRSTSRDQKIPFRGDIIQILDPISHADFRKLLPLLPPPVRDSLPNRLDSFLASRNFLMLSSRRQAEIREFITRAYRGLYKVDDVATYLTEIRDLKRREVEQFLQPFVFDGVVDWFRMIRVIYQKTRPKTKESRKLEDLIVSLQRSYRRLKKKSGNVASTKVEVLEVPAVHSYETLLRKVKKSFTMSLKSLRETFQSIDKNANGDVTMDEFVEMFGSVGVSLDPSEMKALFREFDKAGQGFFKYQNFVEFLFGTKQLGSQHGYLNTLPLVIQEIRTDLKKAFESADGFVKDINGKLSKQPGERVFSLDFLHNYFKEICGHKYSKFQIKQVYKELYQSIENIKGLFTHLVKKPLERRAQAHHLVAEVPKSQVLTSLKNIVYYFMDNNPNESVITKKQDLLLELRFVASEATIKTFFYIFKVGDYIRPFLLKKTLGITKLASKLYTDKTIDEREAITTNIREKFDEEFSIAGRNISSVVEFHLGLQMPSADEQFLHIEPYKMFKIIPLLEGLVDTKEEQVEALILRNLATKFRASYKILAAKNKHSKEVGHFVIDFLIDKVLNQSKTRKSVAKKKTAEETKKAAKHPSVVVSPAVNIEGSDFIDEARSIVTELIMDLPQNEKKQRYQATALKQYIFVRTLHSDPVGQRSALRLGFNDVVGCMGVGGTAGYTWRNDKIESKDLGLYSEALDFVLFENEMFILTLEGRVEVLSVERNHFHHKATIKFMETKPLNLSALYGPCFDGSHFIKREGDRILINMSTFNNTLYFLNTRTYRVEDSMTLNVEQHSLTVHVRAVLKKIRDQVLQRSPSHPKDFFREIILQPVIDKTTLVSFLCKQVPQLFPIEIEQMLGFLGLSSTTEVTLLEVIELIESLELESTPKPQINLQLIPLQKDLLRYIFDNNLSITQLINKLTDKRSGYIPLSSLKDLITRVSTRPVVPLQALYEALDITGDRAHFRPFINFIAAPASEQLGNQIQRRLMTALAKINNQTHLSRIQCQEIAYRNLPEYTHNQIKEYLDALDWPSGKHLFRHRKSKSKLWLWHPPKLLVMDFEYLKSFHMLLYSVVNSHSVFLSQIVTDKQMSLIAVIQHPSVNPVLTFIFESYSLVTCCSGTLRVWNLYSQLVECKTLFPPWTLEEPFRVSPIKSQVTSLEYIHTLGLLLVACPESIRLVNVNNNLQQVRRINYKDKEVIRARAGSFNLGEYNLPPLKVLMVVLRHGEQLLLQVSVLEQLWIKVPGNQTDDKIPIKLRQCLNEMGFNSVSRKLKYLRLHINNMSFSVRSRKVSESSLMPMFYRAAKQYYLFGKEKDLMKIYDLRCLMNEELTVDMLVIAIKDLDVNYSPSKELLDELQNNNNQQPVQVESKTAKANVYELIFLHKLNRESRIKILKEIESLDSEQLNIDMVFGVINGVEPMVSREEVQMLLEKYQRLETPEQDYLIPVNLLRNTLLGHPSTLYIFRKISRLVAKIQQQKPGFYQYQLFGALEERINVNEFSNRLRELGLKDFDIEAITLNKGLVTKAEFTQWTKEAEVFADVFQDDFWETQAHSLPLQTPDQSQLEEEGEQDKSEEGDMGDEGDKRDEGGMGDKRDEGDNRDKRDEEHQGQSKEQQQPKQQQQQERPKVVEKPKEQEQRELNPDQQVKPIGQPATEITSEELPGNVVVKEEHLNGIYTKIANNFNLRDPDEIFHQGDQFYTQFSNRIRAIKAIPEAEANTFFESLKMAGNKSSIDYQQFKDIYSRVTQEIKDKKLREVADELLEHVMVSINFKKIGLVSALKPYWCNDEGHISLRHLGQFIKDIGFVLEDKELDHILKGFGAIRDGVVDAIKIEGVLESMGFKFANTILEEYKWTNNSLGLLKTHTPQLIQLLKKSKKSLKKKTQGRAPDSNQVNYRMVYRLLRQAAGGSLDEGQAKFVINTVFQGKQDLDLERVAQRLNELTEGQDHPETPQKHLSQKDFMWILQDSNPFNQIQKQTGFVDATINSYLQSTQSILKKGLLFWSTSKLTNETLHELSECSQTLPPVRHPEFKTPELNKNTFIHDTSFPVKEIQFVGAVEFDSVGFIVNNRFEGYQDEELCKDKLRVRSLLSNLHNSDVEYRIGEYFCLEGFNPTFYLPNAAINMDWSVIVQFARTVLEQINKAHSSGYCLTNMRYLHLGKNAVIQEVYYPSKINDSGVIISQPHVLRFDSNEEPYMAPQLTNEDHLKSSKIDSWSFGCLLFEFVFGKHPPLYRPGSTYQWLSIQDVTTLLSLEHHQIISKQSQDAQGQSSTRLLLQGLSNIYKSDPKMEKKIRLLTEILGVIGLSLSPDPLHRPSTEELLRHPAFQQKQDQQQQENEQTFTITNNIIKDGNVSSKYKYTVQVSSLDHLTSLNDHTSLLAQSIPMAKVSQVLIVPLKRCLLYWLQERRLDELPQVLEKTQNLFVSTFGKCYPQEHPLFVMPPLEESMFSQAIRESSIKKSIQNRWIRLLMNSQYLECLTYLVCNSQERSLHESYFKLLQQLFRQLRNYQSYLVFYIDRLLQELLKMSFGIPIGFSRDNQQQLRDAILGSFNQQDIDGFSEPTLLSLSSFFSYQLAKDFIGLFEEIISPDGLPSTKYQPIYAYLITHPHRLRYFDSMGNILRLHVSIHTQGFTNPRHKQVLLNRMEDIITQLTQQTNINILEDSRCHLLFMQILNSIDQEIRRKALRYFEALVNVKPIHTIFSAQVLLLSLFGNLRLQSQKTANKVIALKIFKELIVEEGEGAGENKRLKGSYFNTFSEILRLGVAPKQKSLQTSTYLELKPFVEEIVSGFKGQEQLSKIVDAIQGSKTIMEQIN